MQTNPNNRLECVLKNRCALFSAPQAGRKLKNRMKHKLTLLDNAVDSLNESLWLVKSAESHGIRRYKFAILNFCHFTELLFKHFAAELEPSKIIYKTKKGDEKSITLWQALEILEDNGQQIDDDLKDQLEWIRKVRNDIEHYQFEFSINDVELFIGRILSAVLRYSERYSDLELIWHVDDSLKETMLNLANEYQDKLSVALAIVKEQEDLDGSECLSNGGIETYWRKYQCPECGHDTLITNSNSTTGYKCVFCGNTDSDEMEHVCDSCETFWPKQDLKYFDYTNNGDYRHMCPVCLHHPDYE